MRISRINKKDKLRLAKRESAQNCRDYLTDGHIRHLLAKNDVYHGFDRDIIDYSDPEVRYIIETKRSQIWLTRLVRDREKWKNHPATKAWEMAIKKNPANLRAD